MNDKDTTLGIELGNPDNPIAIANIYNENEEEHGIAFYPVLNAEGLNTGDDISPDRVGNMDFILIFRTESSVNVMMDCLSNIKKEMEQKKQMNKTRYEQFKEMSLNDMAVTLSYYFDCSNCPAKKDGCSENELMCIDAITEWLNQSGNF